MAHPVQSMIEMITEKGSCPRLHVDSTVDGVTCPEFVREQWKEKLIVDLDPSYPLNLEFTDDGIHVDLSFGGYVTRCTFPWTSIYIVANRADGKGIVLDHNMPDSLRRKDEAGPEPEYKGDLRELAKRDRKPEGSRRRRRKRTDDEPAEAEAAPSPVAEEEPSVEADEGEGSSEDEAQRRRSVFKVIDGGG